MFMTFLGIFPNFFAYFLKFNLTWLRSRLNLAPRLGLVRSSLNPSQITDTASLDSMVDRQDIFCPNGSDSEHMENPPYHGPNRPDRSIRVGSNRPRTFQIMRNIVISQVKIILYIYRMESWPNPKQKTTTPFLLQA